MPQEIVDAGNVVSLEQPAAAQVPPAWTDTGTGHSEKKIEDSQFMTELNRLRNLMSFFGNEAVSMPLSERDLRLVGELFTLKEGYGYGRSPTGYEWAVVARYNQMLFPLLTDAQRRRFMVGGISQGFARLPIILSIVPLLSLLGSLIVPQVFETQYQALFILPFYLVWLMSLGAIGSIAFIGMNALSVQQDITFDLLNPRLINLRIALGALFSLVLTLPFGFDGFVNFIIAITAPGKHTLSNTDALMLILPFLLGFSTSLVIMILNGLLEAAQSFFGKVLVTTAPPTSSASSTNSTQISGLEPRSGVPGPAKRRGKRATPPDSASISAASPPQKQSP